MTLETVVRGRAQRVRLVDEIAPHGEMIVWQVHSYAVSQAEARKVSRRVHQVVRRAQACPQATPVVPTGDFNVEVEALGRRYRVELQWQSMSRAAVEVMPDAPAAWTGRESSIDRIFSRGAILCRARGEAQG